MANLRIAAKASNFQITIMSLNTFYRVFVITIGVFFILWVGKGLLIPFVVAVFLFFLILVLSDGIQKIGVGKLRMPAQLAIPASLLLILLGAGFLASLITDNIRDVSEAAPSYLDSLQEKTNLVTARLNIEGSVNLGDLIDFESLQGFIPGLLGAIRGLIADAGLIIIYLMFLMLERRTFASKMDALFPDSKKKRRVTEAIDQVRNRVETYIGIKTFNSLLTGLLCYGVLLYAGLDFASFWGVIIFVLNFIPTIGSLIATALPAILAIVQFDSWPPILTVLIGVGVIQFSIGNVLEPRLMGGSLNLSPLIILLSLALWGSLWGIPGMLLCVPFTVIAAIIAKEIPEARPLAIVLSGSGKIGDETENSKSED